MNIEFGINPRVSATRISISRAFFSCVKLRRDLMVLVRCKEGIVSKIGEDAKLLCTRGNLIGNGAGICGLS